MASDLGHNLRSEVDGFVLTGLEEWWGLEVICEESSGFSKDWWDKFEFFSLLFEAVGFFTSLVGGVINDLLEFTSLLILGSSLSNLLVSDGGNFFKLLLKLGWLCLWFSDVLVKGSKVVIADILETSVWGIIFLLVGDVSVFKGVE
jgi:hypothetical protein